MKNGRTLPVNQHYCNMVKTRDIKHIFHSNGQGIHQNLSLKERRSFL